MKGDFMPVSRKEKKKPCEEGSRHTQFHKTFVVIVP